MKRFVIAAMLFELLAPTLASAHGEWIVWRRSISYWPREQRGKWEIYMVSSGGGEVACRRLIFDTIESGVGPSQKWRQDGDHFEVLRYDPDNDKRPVAGFDHLCLPIEFRP